jgi:homoserine O-acetyltransferase/O-succinyltransferase
MFSNYISSEDFYLNFKEFKSQEDFTTESGFTFKGLSIGYHTYGDYTPGKSKVIWVCHALTGSSHVFEWWSGIFGQGKLFDPKEYFIVCANALGSSYGSTGPLNLDSTGNPFYHTFPLITPRDMASAHEVLRKHLGIDKIEVLIGASLGGQQAVEWSILAPSLFERLVLIATNAQHSPYGIAFNESQRMAIFSDPTYGNGTLDDAKDGLKIARSIAMISYRSYAGYNKTQFEEDINKSDDFRASSYQRYQGEKLANRFNAYAYVSLSKSMDAHNVGRNRGGVVETLAKITAKTLVIGIDSDGLFPISEQLFLKEKIKGAQFASISSDFGHDGFLVENEQLVEILKDFLYNDFKRFRPTVFKQRVETKI